MLFYLFCFLAPSAYYFCNLFLILPLAKAEYLNSASVHSKNGVFDVVFCWVALSDSCQPRPVEFSVTCESILSTYTKWCTTFSLLQINYFLNKEKIQDTLHSLPFMFNAPDALCHTQLYKRHINSV